MKHSSPADTPIHLCNSNVMLQHATPLSYLHKTTQSALRAAHSPLAYSWCVVGHAICSNHRIHHQRV
eukprot:scaffold243874_cov19-Tisochrysis_lutea.AAC.1